jgi:hypothetical protein
MAQRRSSLLRHFFFIADQHRAELAMEPEQACYAEPTACSLRYCLAESRNAEPAVAMTAEDSGAEQAPARKAPDDQ